MVAEATPGSGPAGIARQSWTGILVYPESAQTILTSLF